MKNLIILVMLCLTGCVSTQQLNNGLNNLINQDKSVAFDALGYPTTTQQFGDITVYVWQQISQGYEPIPTTTSIHGVIGNRPYYGHANDTSWVPVQYRCVIKLGVDKSDKIQRYEYEGNGATCEMYIRRLERYFSQ